MLRTLRTVAVAASCAAALLQASCSEVPVRRELTQEEQQQLDDSIGQRFAQSIERNFILHGDVEAEVYLRGLAVRLMQGSPSLRDQPVGVLVFREPPGFQSGDERLHFLGLPGVRVYVSLEFLKTVDFENELAAAIALQLAHVEHRHLAKNLQQSELAAPDPKSVLDEIFPATEPRSPKGSGRLRGRRVFRFNPQEMASSITLAVELLYQAGFDPRGLSELWKRYAAMPGRTIYSPDEIDTFIRQTYRTIARYTPLRNPVVRSGAFLAFKKRIAGS